MPSSYFTKLGIGNSTRSLHSTANPESRGGSTSVTQDRQRKKNLVSHLGFTVSGIFWRYKINKINERKLWSNGFVASHWVKWWWNYLNPIPSYTEALQQPTDTINWSCITRLLLWVWHQYIVTKTGKESILVGDNYRWWWQNQIFGDRHGC